ncbi:Aste57867_4856 [Aphanomyces stellatus]|uniref:Aste57867_4856 protein n=1 Tax=Aphanomyces stellatus TaxID=120398 RepID=A0A485KG15_9STRA|nr:hypothetical protein As57867_004843 [Aphanomyces stellatus]VFT81949.1 Aste57867_4856 [Aphanomyces stellatus]
MLNRSRHNILVPGRSPRLRIGFKHSWGVIPISGLCRIRVTSNGKTKAFDVDVLTMTLGKVQAIAESEFNLESGTYAFKRQGVNIETVADFGVTWNAVVRQWDTLK